MSSAPQDDFVRAVVEFLALTQVLGGIGSLFPILYCRHVLRKVRAGANPNGFRVMTGYTRNLLCHGLSPENACRRMANFGKLAIVIGVLTFAGLTVLRGVVWQEWRLLPLLPWDLPH